MTDTDEQTKTYTFDQLSDRAKAKALDWWASVLDNHWAEYVIDDAKEQGKAKGFDIDDVRWSGFWSQGDGASWTGTISVWKFVEWMLAQPEDTPEHRWIDADRHRYLCFVELMKDGWIEPHIPVVRTGYHYVHENTTGPENGVDWSALESESGWDDLANAETVLHSEGILKGASVVGVAEGIDIRSLIPELDDKLEDAVRDFSREIYRMLEAEYDSLTDDEQLADMASANEYRFDEYGEVV